MGYPTDLTDAQWAFIEPIIPPQEGPGRPRVVDLRRVLDALMYQDRTGCQWRMRELDFPPSGTVRYYFDKWNEDGTLLEIHDQLRRRVREQQGRESEPTAIVIDSQSVGCPLGVHRSRRRAWLRWRQTTQRSQTPDGG